MDCGNSGSSRRQIADPNCREVLFLGLKFYQILVAVQFLDILGFDGLVFLPALAASYIRLRSILVQVKENLVVTSNILESFWIIF